MKDRKMKKLCECGCGKEIKKEDKRFVHGHHRRGKKHSLESRRKQSENIKGENHPMYGRKQSKETRKKQSESMKGKNKGKKHSEETRKRISEKLKGRKQSEEHISKVAEKNRGRKRSLESRKNISIAANNAINSRYISGYFYSKKMQKEIFYQTSLELSALEMFEKDENIWSIERCPFSIKYKMNGSFHYYTPDYFLNEKIIYEVRPLWIFGNWYRKKRPEVYQNNLIKFKAAKKYCKKNNLEFKVMTEKYLY